METSELTDVTSDDLEDFFSDRATISTNSCPNSPNSSIHSDEELEVDVKQATIEQPKVVKPSEGIPRERAKMKQHHHHRSSFGRGQRTLR